VTLAIVGIYGVMSWSVSERQREFAIRLALGGRGGTLLALSLRKALLLAVAGIAAGLLGARAAAGVLNGLLFGLEATDAAAYAMGAAAIALVALVACYIPARRALRADPVTLLR
jgi:ABC-type antimicrobial peptide transport system permease subunit